MSDLDEDIAASLLQLFRCLPRHADVSVRSRSRKRPAERVVSHAHRCNCLRQLPGNCRLSAQMSGIVLSRRGLLFSLLLATCRQPPKRFQSSRLSSEKHTANKRPTVLRPMAPIPSDPPQLLSESGSKASFFRKPWSRLFCLKGLKVSLRPALLCFTAEL